MNLKSKALIPAGRASPLPSPHPPALLSYAWPLPNHRRFRGGSLSGGDVRRCERGPNARQIGLEACQTAHEIPFPLLAPLGGSNRCRSRGRRCLRGGG